MAKSLNQLTEEEYNALLDSGMLWEHYPTASGGGYITDCLISLWKLSDLIRESQRNVKQSGALMGHYFHKALLLEGFNEKTANLIEYVSYDRGHSGGNAEIMNEALTLVQFVKEILEANEEKK